MNTNDYMTGAELQALREACGLDRDQLGEMCGVQGRSIKYWEMGASKHGVPADVAELVLKLEANVREDADANIAYFGSAVQLESKIPVFTRGADPIKNAVNNRVWLALRAMGKDVRLVAFDYKAYRDQLQGPDTPEARQQWARRAAKEQAKPHKQDQPASLPPYIQRGDGYIEDRRTVEIQTDGIRIPRDPVTGKRYDIGTGKEIARWDDQPV